jgi:hypothetical protein
MTAVQDPAGAVQSYCASITAVLISITQSDTWTAVIALMAAIVLVIRLYKEVSSLLNKENKNDKS